MAEDKKGELKMPLIHGMPWFPGTTQEMIDTFPRLSARENDIFVATYAKAGKYNNNMAAPRVYFTPSDEKTENKCCCGLDSLLFGLLSYHFARRRSCFVNGRCHFRDTYKIFPLSTNVSLLN